MSLNAKDKEVVRAFWNTIRGSADSIGAEALSRMLAVYPQTKTYFAHWQDKSSRSTNVIEHGKRIMGGVEEAVSKIDTMVGGLLNLSELHAFTLRVDPANFKILSHCILVIIAQTYPDEFTPEIHMAMDKFMAALGRALSEKYR